MPDPKARRLVTAGEVLETTRKGGFTPVFVSNDDAESVAAVKNRSGNGLRVASTGSIEVPGCARSDSYGADIVSKDTVVLMARVGGREVLVFVGRARRLTRSGGPPTGRARRRRC